MAERQPLEQQRPTGAAEVLLCTSEGRLLEGLVTNLFIVAAREGAEAAAGSTAEGNSGEGCAAGRGAGSGGAPGDGGGSGSTAGAAAGGFRRLEVWTASPAEGVVWGTARARVLQACRRLGLAVREEAPSCGARAAWREAFLTNSLRLVQPLHTLACPAGNAAGLPPWELHLPAAPGPVTRALHQELLRLLPTVDVADLAAQPGSAPSP